MYMDREKLLKDIMAVDFTIVDLNLYLNTHPCDQRAIIMFNNAVNKGIMLRNDYQKQYGPLLINMGTSKCPWQWVEGSWPWEKEV